MEYKKPTKLLPLQVYAPFTGMSTMRLISRDEARIRVSSHKPRLNILDSCVKSFPRLYYQPALRQSSFHECMITGKTRVPRKLEPLKYSKTPEKVQTLDEEIQKIKKEVKSSPRFDGLMEEMNEIYMKKDQEQDLVKETNLTIEKQDDFKVDNIKVKTPEIFEIKEESKEELIQNVKTLSTIKENEVLEKKSEIKPNHKKILENGTGIIQWDTSKTHLILESMKIAVEGFEGHMFVPIAHLKYVIFNTREKIEQLIQKFLRVDSEVKWYFYKKKSRKSLKTIDVTSQFPYLVEGIPPDPFPETFEFEAKIGRGPYSYSSGLNRKILVYLPKLLYKTDKQEKASLVSLNNLKGLLKKSSSFPSKVTEDSFNS